MSKQKNGAIRSPDYVMALLGKAMTFMQHKEAPLADMTSGAADRATLAHGSDRRPDRGGKEQISRIDKIRDLCAPTIEAFFNETESISTLSVSAIDGFEIIALSRDKLVKSARFSVISNALATIGRAVSTEFNVGQFDFTMVNSSRGRIVSMHFTGREMGLIMAVITPEDAMLGHLLINLKNICRATSLILDAEQ